MSVVKTGLCGMMERLQAFVPGSLRFGIPVAFVLISLPVFLLAAFLVVRAEQASTTETLIRSTEVQNESLALTLSNAHADQISYLLAFDIGDAPELLPIALRRSGLDELVRASLADTNVINLKLYDGNGITLFSLLRDQLGEDISACPCFTHAVEGNTISELIEAGDHDHAETDVIRHADSSVSLLSTLIPVNVLAPDLTASDSVLEIQTDVSELVALIAMSQRAVILSIGIPLALLYLVMVAIVAVLHFAVLRSNQRALDLSAKLAQIDAANRAKSEFLSLMSHELRTPLNAIIGFSELIGQNQYDTPESETATYARTIHDSGHHMLRQITSILDMTAIELGELDLELSQVRAEESVHAAIARVRDTFDQSLVTLTVLDAPKLPEVMGDPACLQQVFENLLSNAARFTPAGGEVEVVFDTEPGGWICVGIKDTGVGMTREQIERARLPFQHAWTGYAREADGAGLGLTIADKVITQMGGTLVIESQEDVGTTIIVRLPGVFAVTATNDMVRPDGDMAAE
jgi:signal transduction histidine kinase